MKFYHPLLKKRDAQAIFLINSRGPKIMNHATRFNRINFVAKDENHATYFNRITFAVKDE